MSNNREQSCDNAALSKILSEWALTQADNENKAKSWDENKRYILANPSTDAYTYGELQKNSSYIPADYKAKDINLNVICQDCRNNSKVNDIVDSQIAVTQLSECIAKIGNDTISNNISEDSSAKDRIDDTSNVEASPLDPNIILYIILVVLALLLVIYIIKN